MRLNRRQVTLSLLGGVATVAAASRRSPQVARLSRSLAGQAANLRDYCLADGRRMDTQNYQELLDLQPSIIVYPPDTRLVLDAPVQLRSNQLHKFSVGARIDAEANGYALFGIGTTGQHLANLSAPVPRFARKIVVERTPPLRAGDVIVLADVSIGSSLKLDINEVQSLTGNVIATRYPIGRPFASASGFRLYRLENPLRELAISGKVVLTNHHPQGGGLRVNSGVDLCLTGLTVEDTGYIGIAVESSLRAQLNTICVRRTGASGLGIRESKVISINGFEASNVRADESLTLYDNVAHVSARNIAIEQYLYEERSAVESAGNDILVDLLCSDIALAAVNCSGSATYNVMFNNQCDGCSLTNFALARSNLGGVRLSAHCTNTRISSGTISDVTSSTDGEARKPVSAITVGNTCSGTVISNVRYDRIATGRHVDAMEEP